MTGVSRILYTTPFMDSFYPKTGLEFLSCNHQARFIDSKSVTCSVDIHEYYNKSLIGSALSVALFCCGKPPGTKFIILLALLQTLHIRSSLSAFRLNLPE